MRYFLTPQYCVPLNAKVASSTTSRKIIEAYYPDINAALLNARYPENLNADRVQLHRFIPAVDTPTLPVAMLVREPVARFLSGVAYLQLDVSAAISSLYDNSPIAATRPGRQITIRTQTNIHFLPQDRLPYGETHLFKFPEHVDAFAAFLGLSSFPQLNATTTEKPSLADEQTQAVLQYYADDVALYNSIATPNTVIVRNVPSAPPEVLPPPTSITATQIRLWLVRNGIALEQVAAAIAAIPDPQARAEAEVLWEYAPYVERANTFVEMLGEVFNMDAAAIDNAFREAALI